MERVKLIQLKNMVKFLNNDIGTEDHKIALDQAYGGYQLVIVHIKEGYGESDLSRRLTAREMYECLYTIQNIIRVVGSHNWIKLVLEKKK